MRSLWAFLVADWHATHIVRVLCAVAWGVIHFAASLVGTYLSYTLDSATLEESVGIGLLCAVMTVLLHWMFWWGFEMTDHLVEAFDEKAERGREIIRSSSGAAQGAGHLSTAEGS